MIDWTGKMWHIYTMEYYAAIKNDEFVSFVGTWMNLEHHSQQTDTRTENEMPHVLTHRRVMNNENHGHREGSTTHWGLLGGIGEEQQCVGSWGEIA